jgi:hypothetical protein
VQSFNGFKLHAELCFRRKRLENVEDFAPIPPGYAHESAGLKTAQPGKFCVKLDAIFEEQLPLSDQE